MKKLIRKFEFSFEEVQTWGSILFTFAVIFLAFSFYSEKESHRIIGFALILIAALPSFYRYTAILSGANFQDNNVSSDMVWMILFSFFCSIAINELTGLTFVFISEWFLLDLFFAFHIYLVGALIIFGTFTFIGLAVKLKRFITAKKILESLK